MAMFLLMSMYILVLLYWSNKCNGFLFYRLPLRSRSNKLQMTPPLISNNEFVHHNDNCVYDKLSRVELQRLAKENNVRANLKSVDIIAALDHIRTINLVKTEAITPIKTQHYARKKKKKGVTRNYEVEDENDEGNDEYLEVLKEQGLDWSDVFAQAAHLTDPNRPKRISVKRDIKPKAVFKSTEITKEKPAMQIAPVQYLGKTLSSRDISLANVFQRPATRQRSDISDQRDNFDRPLQPFSRLDRKVSQEAEFSRDPDSVRLRTRKSVAPSTQVHIDLEGTTLKAMLEFLIKHIGYETLHRETHLRCFLERPSMSSSLKVLRQPDMEWARKRIEHLFIQEKKRNGLDAT